MRRLNHQAQLGTLRFYGDAEAAMILAISDSAEALGSGTVVHNGVAQSL